MTILGVTSLNAFSGRADLLHVLLVENEDSELRAWVVSTGDTVVHSVNGASLNLACVPDGPVPTKEGF